ncbi:MAG: glycosyltransferase family 2 protein [Acidovorax sp.]|uniref:glycosyltransferase family 2 protein n=1 Tax=Acidovorax sp. TaxID=1872122 RepID=UPI0039E6703A
MSAIQKTPSIAVIIPCFNEALAIGQVLDDFKAVLPEATLYVFDNNSTDDTSRVAQTHGAIVVHVPLRGKGNVVRRMFADVEADIYVMADGDATYHAPSARKMIDLLIDKHLDMIVAARVETEEPRQGITYRPGHRLGNKFLTSGVQIIFGGSFRDMLSGYRVFSRRYVKSFPAHSHGFEIETELNVHALELRMPCTEIDTPYGARLEGSISKLSTYRDGWHILKTIGRLVLSEKPLQFFGWLAAVLMLTSVALAAPIIYEFEQTGLVRRFPTLVLVTAMMVCGVLSGACGLILHGIRKMRRELKRFAYLRIEAAGNHSRS